MAEVKPVEAVSPLPPEPKKAAKKKKKAKEKAKPSPAPVHTSSSSSFPPSASLSMPASLPSAFVPSALPVQAFAQTPTALPLPMNPLSPPTSGASNKRKGDHDSSGKKGKKRKTDHKSPGTLTCPMCATKETWEIARDILCSVCEQRGERRTASKQACLVLQRSSEETHPIALVPGFVLTPSQPGMEKQAKSTERTAPVQKSPVAPLPMASLNIAALPFTPAPTTQQQRKKSSNKKKKQVSCHTHTHIHSLTGLMPALSHTPPPPLQLGRASNRRLTALAVLPSLHWLCCPHCTALALLQHCSPLSPVLSHRRTKSKSHPRPRLRLCLRTFQSYPSTPRPRVRRELHR